MKNKAAGAHQKKVLWAIVLTEMSHVFCCVLPTLFSLVSLLAGVGIIVTLPGWLGSLHNIMHGYELAMIIFSACVIMLGWAFHFYSYKEDCHDHGCGHKPCGPTKRRANKILIAATMLFVVNIVIYFGAHRHQNYVNHFGQLHEAPQLRTLKVDKAHLHHPGH